MGVVMGRSDGRVSLLVLLGRHTAHDALLQREQAGRSGMGRGGSFMPTLLHLVVTNIRCQPSSQQPQSNPFQQQQQQAAGTLTVVPRFSTARPSATSRSAPVARVSTCGGQARD